MTSRHLLAGALAAASLLAVADAHAAGLYFSDRGVRPLGRGGAFVAGADDLGAIWYNPAGIADTGGTILVDFSWLHFSSDYTRRTIVNDSAGVPRLVESPTVQGSTPVLPIPTLAGAFNLDEKKELTLAFGLYAPYTAITSYPLTVGGAPAPQRYSLLSMDGSLMAVPGAYIAYKPFKELRIGVGGQLLSGYFKSTVDFSASPPNRLIASPEDPLYDAMSELKVGPIFAPSANAGVIVEPDPHVRIGLTGQLPFVVNAPATIKVRLPNAAEFDSASQVGEKAHVRFALPAVFRIGVEGRPTEKLRVELAYVREFWVSHQAIDITPDNIKLYNVTAFPSPFAVSPISIPRNFQDSNSFHLGGEFHHKIDTYDADLRAGVSYEQSAVPAAYLSPLTIDLNKITAAIGGSLYIGEHWRLDAVYAHVFGMSQTVSPSEAKVPRVNPVQGNPTATEPVNGGDYSARADVLGVGLRYKF